MMRNVLKKNKPFIIVLLLLFLVVAIVARSDIRVTATFGFDIKPHSQVDELKITARLLPFEAIRTGDDWLIQGFL